MYSFVHCRAGAAAAPKAFNPTPHSVGTIITRGWQPVHGNTPAQHAQHAAACEGGTEAGLLATHNRRLGL